MDSLQKKMSGLKVSPASAKAAAQVKPQQYFLHRVDPETGKITEIAWTSPAKTSPLTVKRHTLSEEFLPRTIAQEVWYLVKEWYRVRGIPVPPSEEKECLEAIEKEAVDAGAPPPPSEPLPPSKPVYGTPEFWKAWWAKKKAKEAAAAAAAPAETAPAAPKPVKKTMKKKEVAV